MGAECALWLQSLGTAVVVIVVAGVLVAGVLYLANLKEAVEAIERNTEALLRTSAKVKRGR